MRLSMRAPSVRRAFTRLAGTLAICSLLFAILTSGKKYFFCAAMDRWFANDACCTHFEPSFEDQIAHETEGAAIAEDESCCDLHEQRALPNATAALGTPVFEAAWTAVVPELPSLETSARDSFRPIDSWRALPTGPPLESAAASCARLSVFLI